MRYGARFGLANLPAEKRADRAAVLEAVRKNGWALQFAAPELRADREFVLEAVRQSGFALEYAADELRSDREVVLEAVRQHPLALQHAASTLRDDAGAVAAMYRAAASAMAVDGAQSPVFTVPDVSVQEDGMLEVVVYNLAGDSMTEVLSQDAALEELARRLMEWHGHCRDVFMDFPGHGAPSPWDCVKTLAEWTGAVIPQGEP